MVILSRCHNTPMEVIKLAYLSAKKTNVLFVKDVFMKSKFTKIVIWGVIAIVVLNNFDYFFNLFEHIALILFVPLVVLIIAFVKNDK